MAPVKQDENLAVKRLLDMVRNLQERIDQIDAGIEQSMRYLDSERERRVELQRELADSFTLLRLWEQAERRA